MEWQWIATVKSFVTLAHGGKLKYHGNLLWNFTPRKCKYCGNLLRCFYNIGPWTLFMFSIFWPSIIGCWDFFPLDVICSPSRWIHGQILPDKTLGEFSTLKDNRHLPCSIFYWRRKVIQIKSSLILNIFCANIKHYNVTVHFKTTLIPTFTLT